MHSRDGMNQAARDWSSPPEVPYQQQQFLPKSPRRLHVPYKEGAPPYMHWSATQYQDGAPLLAADGSEFSRRYSLEAPFENIVHYNRRLSATSEHPLDNVLPSMSKLSRRELAPNSDDDPPSNFRRVPFFYENIMRSATDSNVTNADQIAQNLTLFGRFLEVVQGWPLPPVSFTTVCVFVLLATFISPRLWTENIIFPTFRLSFGTLYPAYASYKAVRTKNVKEYVKWMMYWIVYAFFTCIETFTDIFLSWFPFYYEVKVIIVLWLLSPATKGSSTLYRKFVHPMLTRREQEIDEYLNQAKERGYSAVLQLGTKGVNYATNVIMQTALKGGGNLVQTIRRSYSLSDLSEPDVHRTQDEIDDVVHMRTQQRMLRPRPQAGIGRSASGTRHSTGMYFSEVDVTAKGADGFNYNIRSSEDISSGYSSAEPVSVGLSRTSSMTNASKGRLKSRRTEIFDEQKQFSPPEQNLLTNISYPAPGRRCAEYEFALADNEDLVNHAVLKVHKTVQIIENLTQAKFESEPEPNDLHSPSRTMQTIEEINDLDEQSLDTGATQQQEEYLRHTEESLPHEMLSRNAEANKCLALVDKIDFQSNADILDRSEDLSQDDNESDEFADALPSSVEERIEEGKFTSKENIVVKSLQKPQKIATNELQLTDTAAHFIGAKSSESAQLQNTENTKDTLNAIQHNYPVTIATTTVPATTTMTSTIIATPLESGQTVSTRPLAHSKGKAPAPPTPLRPASSVDTKGALRKETLDAASNSSRSPSPAPHKSVFKNLKTNLFRFSNNHSNLTEQQVVEKNVLAPTPYETQL